MELPIFIAAAALIVGMALVMVRRRWVLTERTARERDQGYRSIVEDQMELVSRSDAAHRLTFVNDAYCRFYGRPRETLLGNSFIDHIMEEERPEVLAALARLTPDNPIEHMQNRVVDDSGAVRWYGWANRGIFDADGRLVEILSVGREMEEARAKHEALLKSEEKFATAFRASPDSLLIIRREDRIVVDANDRFLRSVTATREELLGRSIAEFAEWVDNDARVAFYAVIRDRGQAVDFPAQMRTRDGKLQHMRFSARPIEIDGDDCVLVICRDVTEWKQAEDALRASEARYRAIVEDQTELIARSRVDGTLTFVNDAFCRYFDRSPDELIGTSLMPLVFEQDREMMKEVLAGLGLDRPAITHRHRNYARHGRVRWHEWTDRAIFRDDGAIVEIQSVGRDITEQKNAEDALNASRERLTTTFDMAPDAIISVDKDFRISLFNLGAAQIFGHDAGDMLGKPLDTLIPERFHDAHRNHMAIFADGRETRRAMNQRGRVFGLRKDGSEFPAEASISKQGGGADTLYTVVLRDVSQREAWEAQLREAQKMEAIGQLTGGVAHDFNNLLTIILGNMQLLERRLDDDEGARLAATAIAAAVRGGDLTHRLLAFARRQPLEPKATDLNALVAETSRLLSRTIGENIAVHHDLAGDLWQTHVDQAQLQNALLNLALNAGQAMPTGGRLEIVTRNASITSVEAGRGDGSRPGDYVTLRVSDNGSGMAPEVVAQAFDPFYTTKEVGQGSGLGLSMVYGFAKQSGGDARIESAMSEGTAVTLYLPRVQDLDADSAGAPTWGNGHGSETVLVVEDNPDVREIAIGHLNDRGYRIVEAHDGPDALNRLQRGGRIDVLFTDIVLPNGLSGTDLAHAARRLRPGLKVLFTSGNAMIEIGRDYPSGDGFAFLAKPYMGDELASAMRTLIEDKGLPVRH